MTKTVLLLGAGFSFDPGMPLTAEVTDVFFSLFDERRAHSLARLLASQNPYSSERPISPDAVRAALDLLLVSKKGGETNYEAFLARLEDQADAPQSTQPARDSIHYVFSCLYSLIYDILYRCQVQSYEIMYTPAQRWFRGLLNLLNPDEPTWAFTLNHDLLLECLALDFGVPVSTGDTREPKIANRPRLSSHANRRHRAA